MSKRASHERPATARTQPQDERTTLIPSAAPSASTPCQARTRRWLQRRARSRGGWRARGSPVRRCAASGDAPRPSHGVPDDHNERSQQQHGEHIFDPKIDVGGPGQKDESEELTADTPHSETGAQKDPKDAAFGYRWFLARGLDLWRSIVSGGLGWIGPPDTGCRLDNGRTQNKAPEQHVETKEIGGRHTRHDLVEKAGRGEKRPEDGAQG